MPPLFLTKKSKFIDFSFPYHPGICLKLGEEDRVFKTPRPFSGRVKPSARSNVKFSVIVADAVVKIKLRKGPLSV
jgi:hypothetical protein